jgi:ABC-type transport system involved in multi-copper enzyme maturation permease subunit
MIGSITSEWRKLRQRPAYLVGAALVVGIMVLVYSVNYYQFTWPSAANAAQAAINKQTLYPADFVLNVINASFPLGAALAIVLGALTSGAEYGWGTLKTLLTQQPGRLTGLAGRLVAMGIWLGLLSVTLYAVGALCSLVVALVDGHAVIWPSTLVIAQALGATWLILGCYSLFGLALGFAFRQAAAAIGLGIIYLVLIQTLVVRFLTGLGSAYQWVAKVFDGESAGSLVQSFGTAIPDPHAPSPLMSGNEAVLVLAVYAVGFAIVSAALLWRRDVT